MSPFLRPALLLRPADVAEDGGGGFDFFGADVEMRYGADRVGRDC